MPLPDYRASSSASRVPLASPARSGPRTSRHRQPLPARRIPGPGRPPAGYNSCRPRRLPHRRRRVVARCAEDRASPTTAPPSKGNEDEDGRRRTAQATSRRVRLLSGPAAERPADAGAGRRLGQPSACAADALRRRSRYRDPLGITISLRATREYDPTALTSPRLLPRRLRQHSDRCAHKPCTTPLGLALDPFRARLAENQALAVLTPDGPIDQGDLCPRSASPVRSDVAPRTGMTFLWLLVQACWFCSPPGPTLIFQMPA